MPYGRIIQEYRKKAGLTQKELAERINVAPGTIQQYERDLREPKAQRLREIAAALNTSVLNFVSDEEDGQNIYDIYWHLKKMLPDGYEIEKSGDESGETLYLYYPDNYVIDIELEKARELIDDTADYFQFKLDSLRK